MNENEIECDGRGCNCDGDGIEKIETNPIELLEKEHKIKQKKRKVEKQMKTKGGIPYN